MLIGLVFDPVIEIHVQPVIFLMESQPDIILRNNRRLDQLSVCFSRECIHLMRNSFYAASGDASSASCLLTPATTATPMQKNDS